SAAPPATKLTTETVPNVSPLEVALKSALQSAANSFMPPFTQLPPPDWILPWSALALLIFSERSTTNTTPSTIPTPPVAPSAIVGTGLLGGGGGGSLDGGGLSSSSATLTVSRAVPSAHTLLSSGCL